MLSYFANQMRTFILLALLTVLLVLAGRAIGGQSGMMIAFLFAIVMNFGGYWFSDRIALSMTRSREVSEQEAPEYYSIVRKLTEQADMPMPRLYITPSPQANAFATGRDPNHAAVAVTEGILRILNRDELEGVIAHELAHIRNRDILIGSLAAVIAGAITMLANWAQWALLFGGLGRDDENHNPLLALPLILLAPLAAGLIQMAISRSREFLADETGALISGNPHALANALLKLEQSARQIPMQVNPAASHMFIVNPLRGVNVAHLFSTHPPIEERVRRLRAMA